MTKWRGTQNADQSKLYFSDLDKLNMFELAYGLLDLKLEAIFSIVPDVSKMALASKVSQS